LITGVCLDNEIDFIKANPINPIVIYIKDIRRILLPLADVKSLFKLIKILKELNPEIVHTHTSKAGVLGRRAVKVASPRTKVVHTFHGHLLYGYFPKWNTNLGI
jgi:hypothetical protein